jgi:hypothetical protein
MSIFNNLGQVKLGWRSSVVAQVQTSSLLLDTYSGATAAYSLRKLSGAYTGSTIRVRRSSDNTEQNIGFDGSGNLDTTSLLSFVGSGNGFVTTWYDQSGNGYNFTQTTAANQPQIVSTGSITTKNSKPTIKFDGLNDYMTILNSQSTFSFLHKIGQSFVSFVGYGVSSTEYVLLENNWGSTAHIGYSLWITANNNIVNFITRGVGGSPVSSNTNASNTIVPNTLFMVNTEADPGNASASLRSKLYFNNSSVVTNNVYTNTTSTSNATYNLNLGAAVGVSPYSFLNGGFSELIIYNSDQSANRSSIASNINTYYSIYASDTDAQAFITAAGITDNTQINAINTLVTDLKSAGVWTKMKALYPFVGGTSTTHKWNLKDPRDLNDAFRLTFSGGWTHSSTGALPNGTTGYAETYFNPSTNLTLYSTHISFYSRTNNTLALWKTDFAVEKEISTGNMSTITLYVGTPTWAGAWITSADSARAYAYIGNSTGLFLGNRTSVNNIQISRNGLVGGISTVNANTISGGTQYPTDSPIIGGKKYISPTNVVSYRDFSNREVAFASLGDGLTNYESYNFYKAVEKFQTSLGRQMGSNIPTASDIDVQMFLNATQITDTTQINAISTLVSQLKSNNLWDKMRVIYPFVGGTSNTHKFNLKDPRDINEAYRLTFSGGVTHDSNGIKGSTNGYANTYFSPLTLNQNSIHFSWYSNINSLGVKADIGTLGGGRLLGYSINGAGTNWAVRINNTSNVFSTTQTTDTIGFYQVSRTSSTSIIMQKNNTQDTVSSTSTTSQSNNIILLSGSGSAEFSDRQLQLVTIGEGLTTTEMNTLKTINDNYKTNLGR